MSFVVENGVPALLAVLKEDLLRRAIDTVPLRDERDAILHAWPTPRLSSATLAPGRLPACHYLDKAVAAAASGPARRTAEAISPVRDALQWRYDYPLQPRWPDLASRMAFAPIIAAPGLMDADGVHLGLTLMAPHTHYPLHSHPAVELYLVLAGNAAWRVEGRPFAPQPPGALILHQSGIGHAMTTDAEPLLAVYFWRGDLVTAPAYIDER